MAGKPSVRRRCQDRACPHSRTHSDLGHSAFHIQVGNTTIVEMHRCGRHLNAPLFASSFDSTHCASIRDECRQIIEFGKDGSYSRG